MVIDMAVDDITMRRNLKKQRTKKEELKLIENVFPKQY